MPGSVPSPSRIAPADGAPRRIEEATLVSGVRQGDPQAFERLYRAYRLSLVRLATRYAPSRAIADEVVQEVFLAIWRGRAEWAPGSNVTAYLFAATRHAAMNAARRGRLEARWLAPLDDSALNATSVASPDTTLDTNDRIRALDSAARALPARVREAFLLRWRDELSYAEIAQVMGVSIKTVEKHLGVAVKAIRAAVAP